jgi:hypothetical protein
MVLGSAAFPQLRICRLSAMSTGDSLRLQPARIKQATTSKSAESDHFFGILNIASMDRRGGSRLSTRNQTPQDKTT